MNTYKFVGTVIVDRGTHYAEEDYSVACRGKSFLGACRAFRRKIATVGRVYSVCSMRRVRAKGESREVLTM